ncbi:hypothetical protein HQ563_01530 [bacterium]|nr:hypothetical protein [bacterium]
MFVRKVTLTENRKKQVYLEIFDRQPRLGKEAKPIARLGPVNLLEGKLDNLVRSLGEFCGDSFVSANEVSAERILPWGPVLVARHLWEDTGLADAISTACGVKVAEAAFALTANRLVDPFWKYGIDNWLEKVFIPGELGSRRGAAGSRKGPGTSEAPLRNRWDNTLRRLVAKRRVIERAILDTVKGMCSGGDEVVVYELDTSFVERMSPRRPFMGWTPQSSEKPIRLCFGAIVCEGWPLAIRFFGSGEPNAVQIKRFIEEGKRRFGARKVLFVAPPRTDEEKLDLLDSQGFHYLVGVRRRRDPRAVEVIQQAGRQWVRIGGDIRVQEVLLPVETDASLRAKKSDQVATERFFLVRSRQEEKEEIASRTSVVSRALRALEEIKRAVENGRLKKPATIMARAERILAQRKSYRYISCRITPEGRFDFWEDERKSTVQRAYEGISLLKTNDADISPSAAVALYEGLRRLQKAFQTIPDTAAFRSTPLPLPDFEERLNNGDPGRFFTGHLLISQFALLLRRQLAKRLLEKKIALSLDDVIEALETISVAELRLGKKKHLVVSSGNRTAGKIVRALGIGNLEPNASTATGEAGTSRR